MPIAVRKHRKRKMIHDDSSPLLYYLKLVSRSFRTYDIRKIARRIEKVGALSAEDVYHVLHAFVREMKEIIREGDKVKIDGFGIFHLTIHTTGVEKEEDCHVRNIRKVNIRFKVDPALRLENEATATTRGGENGVEFCIREVAETGGSDECHEYK